MDRTKALVVLHTISDNCKMVIVDVISLDSVNSKINIASKNYQIKMKCSCDIHSCKALTNIMKKYELEMKEENGFLILNSRT